jgi:hypothetical protein
MNEASLIGARRAFLVVALAHFALLTGGFFALAPLFGFPDILRAPAGERLAAFRAHEGAIVAAYYAMALSGLTQIALAVTGHRALQQRDTTLALAALIAGVLGGAWQIMGFIRWPITIPYLAQAMADGANPETLALMEGLLNRYAGMAVGEHLGFLGQGAWTLLFALAAMNARALPRMLGWSGAAFGAAFLVASLEQLGGPFAAFGQITTPLTAAWFAWAIMSGAAFARAGAGAAKPFGLISILAYVLFAAALVATTML